MWNDRLQRKIFDMRNPSVVGLDPRLDFIPPEIMSRAVSEYGETLKAASEAASEFCRRIIDGVCDIVPAVKPQSAYFEALGHEGAGALAAVCEYAAEKGLYVIMDAKRGDIGTTAEAYSAAYLSGTKVGGTELRPYKCDAVTVNAYLGSDGIKPFLGDAVKNDRMLFALVKTSNPSSGELQNRNLEDETLYSAVGGLMESLSSEFAGEYGYGPIGAVVGATYPRELAELREKLSHTFFLVPGYGAQGGTGDDVRGAFDRRGGGAIVNSSRGIICAWKKLGIDCGEAARAEAIRMRDEMRRVSGI